VKPPTISAERPEKDEIREEKATSRSNSVVFKKKGGARGKARPRKVIRVKMEDTRRSMASPNLVLGVKACRLMASNRKGE